MTFDRDYTLLLQRAAELEGFSGYLDNEGHKQLAAAESAYAKELNRITYDILSEKPDLDLVFQRIQEDLGAIAEEEDSWSHTCEFVANDLIDRLSRESKKSSALRRTVRYAVPTFLVFIAAVYFGFWWYNNLTIDSPLESKAGIVQRAQAYDKARTYNNLMGTRTRRGGLIKMILSKPLEPDEGEFEAASDFVGLNLQAIAFLDEQGVICEASNLLNAENLDESHLAVIDDIAEQIDSPEASWQDPPMNTVLSIVADQFPCTDSPESGGD